MTYLECVSLAWSQQSDKYLLVGARDHCCYIFNSADGSLVMKTQCNGKAVVGALMCESDSKVMVLGLDQKLAVYSLTSKQIED